MIIGAGTLAVWRPWATPPALIVPADTELTPAQQAAAAAGQILSPRLPRAPSSERPLLMVLPFRDASPQSDHGYVAEGLTDDLITALGRTTGLALIGRHTSFAFQGRPVDAQAIGQQLGVRYLLEASAERSADQIKLSVQLIDTNQGNAIWSDRIERPLSEVLSVLDDLSDRVTAGIAPKLRRREAPRASPATAETLAALDLIWQARLRRSSTDFAEAIEVRRTLERAIAIDPGLARGYVALHNVINQTLVERGATADQWLVTAQQLLDIAGKAVSLAPSDPSARAAYADSLTLISQHGTAVAQMESVISATTTDAELLRAAATVMSRAGEFERSVGLMKRALRLDPIPQPGHLASPLASTLYLQNNYAEAVEYSGLCVKRAPTDALCRLWYAASLAQARKPDEARQQAAALQQLGAERSASDQARLMAPGYRDPEHLRHIAEGLRKAGLPD
ncbi:MAG: hypothetical protein ACKODG_05295 [Betaproteobacteria bacterium]